MSKGAKLLEVIYVDTEEPVNVLIGLGDSIRAAEWAEAEYPYPAKPELPADLSPAEVDFRIAEFRRERLEVDAKREWRSGLYAVFLGAQREARGSARLARVARRDHPAGRRARAGRGAVRGESDAPQSAS